MLIDQPGIYPNLPIEDYHAGPGISTSHLKKIWYESAYAYAYEYSYLGQIQPRDARKWSEATPRHMALGGATAALMDGQEVFDRTYYVLPEVRDEKGKLVTSKNSNAWKEAFRGAVVAHPDKTVILPTEREQAETIAEAPYNHPDPETREQLKAYLNNPDLRAECSFYRLDPETGLLVKTRPDLSLKGASEMDVKTSADCREYVVQKRIHDKGHHIQAALGLDVINDVERTLVDKWMLLVIEQSAPYDVALYYLDQPTLAKGREIYRNALRTLAGCLKRGQWPGKSSGLREIGIPAYALNEDIKVESVDSETGVIR